MGLISKTVMVKWGSSNKQYYIKQGYKFTKMGDEFEVKTEDLSKGCGIRVKCKCDNCGCELNWEYKQYNKIVKKDGTTYCNTCAMKLYGIENIKKSHLKNSKTFEQWCIENNKQDILDRWDFELNDCKPSEVGYGSQKKYWFKCEKHIEHKSELKCIGIFTSGQEKYIECKQCKSIAQWILNNNLKIEDYWDYDKNFLNPWEIGRGSDKKIWIKCQEKDYHESYEVSCNNFTHDHRCPYCRGLKVHPRNSLGQYIINIYGKEFLWNVWGTKNKKSPFEYSHGSNIKVWWKCLDDKHKEYLRGCNSSKQREFRCPKCMENRMESIIEEYTRLYLESLGYDILHEYNCTIIPINPKTKHLLPYDNEIILDNGERLIIEVHGEQHYNIVSYKSKWLDGLSPKEYLHKRQLYDRYKRVYAIQHGYYYLEIPYTTFDSKDTYKKLIDDKINEILNKNY